MTKLKNTPSSTQNAHTQEEIHFLRAEIDILRNIIARIPGNVFWKDNEGRFLGCNNNVAHILGLSSPKDIIGKKNNELFNVELAESAEQIDRMVSFTATEKYIEEIGLDIHHNPATYLTKKLPLHDQFGKVIGILGVALDITDRKKMEEALKIAKEKAEASSQAKTQFLAVVNHELRTPLASIIGLLDFLKQDCLTKTEEEKIIDAIENCTQHLLNLVNEVLEFSRLETSQYQICHSTINLRTLLEEVFDITKTLAYQKALEFSIECDPNIPQFIHTDPRIIRQILINLVSNSIKFTDKGSVKIHLQKMGCELEKTTLAISVIDSGIGIPKEKLALIFEPFQQLEDAYTRQSSRSGTGLGLAIVKKMAALISANIEVSSELNQGSKFSLIGDFVTSNDTSTLNPAELTVEKKLNLKSPSFQCEKKIYPDLLNHQPHILLIEDDPIVQFVHKKMLTDLGCKVDAFTHGQAAINALSKHDLIFVDITLPDISGFEVINIIRHQLQNSSIPIIALTVYTNKEEKNACLKAGANQFMSKPVSPTHFKKLILKYLK